MASRPILAAHNSKTCRICLDNDNPEDFIRPCLCSGGSAYVHRKCLDSWRAVNKNGRAFEYCDVCRFQFVIEPVVDDPAADKRRLMMYRLLVTRDITLVILVLQVIIVGMTFLIQALDRQNHALRDLFPESANSFGIYYLCSVILFLAVLGFIGLIAYCLSSTGNDGTGNDGCNCGFTEGYFAGMWCNDCGRHNDCNGDCNGNGGGDCGSAVLVICLVVVVILAIFGIFFGIILGGMLVQNITQRHTKKLWLKQEAKKYVVKDFTGNADALRNISAQRSVRNLSSPNTINNSNNNDRTRTQPSAPPLELESLPASKIV